MSQTCLYIFPNLINLFTRSENILTKGLSGVNTISLSFPDHFIFHQYTQLNVLEQVLHMQQLLDFPIEWLSPMINFPHPIFFLISPKVHNLPFLVNGQSENSWEPLRQFFPLYPFIAPKIDVSPFLTAKPKLSDTCNKNLLVRDRGLIILFQMVDTLQFSLQFGKRFVGSLSIFSVMTSFHKLHLFLPYLHIHLLSKALFLTSMFVTPIHPHSL